MRQMSAFLAILLRFHAFIKHHVGPSKRKLRSILLLKYFSILKVYACHSASNSNKRSHLRNVSLPISVFHSVGIRIRWYCNIRSCLSLT